MKKQFLLSVLLTLFVSVSFAQQYGPQFDVNDAMDVESFKHSMMAKDNMEDIAVTGTITEVCQAAGCWLKLENENGEDIFVKFKEENGNHELVVPKDIAGKTVTVYGNASKKTISVKEQKHYAEDAGASKKEIAKIKEPKQQLRIDATAAVVD